MKKYVVTGIVVLIIAAVFSMRLLTSKNDADAGKSGSSWGNKSRAATVAVKTADVQYGTIRQQRELTGTVKAAYNYTIAAKVSGRLEKIFNRIGDKIADNEIVGTIDNTEYLQAFQEAEAQIAVSKASVNEAEAQMLFAKSELERIKELFEKGITSKADYDAAQTQSISQKSKLDLAKAQLAQREAAFALAKTRLAYTTIRAPQKGYVAVRHTDGGALLSVNSPILTIVGIDTVFVEISIPEKDYSLIEIGQSATISVEALPDKIFLGKVSSASPLFQTATRTAIVEIAIKNDSLLLKPGMFARISVTLAQKDSAQIIPLTALVNRNSKNAVFVADQSSIARLIPVTVGFIDGDRVEIVEPKLNGKLITLGNHLLSDGASVLIDSGNPQVGKSENPNAITSGSSTNKSEVNKKEVK